MVFSSLSPLSLLASSRTDGWGDGSVWVLEQCELTLSVGCSLCSPDGQHHRDEALSTISLQFSEMCGCYCHNLGGKNAISSYRVI